MTGGAMDDLSSIQKCAGLVKKLKPLSTIAAGMGLKGTADIKRLAVVEEIDAVVIGTSFLQALQKGLSDAQKFIAEIEPALYRSFIPIP